MSAQESSGCAISIIGGLPRQRPDGLYRADRSQAPEYLIIVPPLGVQSTRRLRGFARHRFDDESGLGRRWHPGDDSKGDARYPRVEAARRAPGLISNVISTLALTHSSDWPGAVQLVLGVVSPLERVDSL